MAYHKPGIIICLIAHPCSLRSVELGDDFRARLLGPLQSRRNFRENPRRVRVEDVRRDAAQDDAGIRYRTGPGRASGGWRVNMWCT